MTSEIRCRLPVPSEDSRNICHVPSLRISVDLNCALYTLERRSDAFCGYIDRADGSLVLCRCSVNVDVSKMAAAPPSVREGKPEYRERCPRGTSWASASCRHIQPFLIVKTWFNLNWRQNDDLDQNQCEKNHPDNKLNRLWESWIFR